ncbi:dihydropteroate synthase [Pseudoclavibacter helvolus]|uniref:dihydropteroate synthase n=1 Tax=Pseudoclavibacter helvolus TaxID=255205 RepID=UPI003C78C055
MLESRHHDPQPHPPLAFPKLRYPAHRLGSGEAFDFSRHIAVMAIVNRTPDSFYDGGATFGLQSAVDAVLAAERAGADIVDIGGQPFAPGEELSEAEEIERVVPVIRAVRERTSVPISAETYRARVAEACIRAGAGIINDTSGLRDEDLARVVADSGSQLVITHSVAAPRATLSRPRYGDVVGEVRAFLQTRADRALELGVGEDQLIIDPGHDLNKNTLHTLELTRRFDEISSLGFPSLAAVSNKDFIGETLDREKRERLAGSLASAVACILLGARIVRMHNVPEAVDATRMTEAILGLRAPAYTRHNV